MKGISSLKMSTLCNMADNVRLSARTIKSIIRPIWPRKKDITPDDVFYIRYKVMKMPPTLQDNPDYDEFKEQVYDYILLNHIDDEVDLDGNMAHELAMQMWLDVLHENMNEKDSILTFVQYLELIQENAKGFVFELAMDEDGNVHGVVWQATTMGDNFEHFGSYILLDTMK